MGRHKAAPYAMLGFVVGVRPRALTPDNLEADGDVRLAQTKELTY